MVKGWRYERNLFPLNYNGPLSLVYGLSWLYIIWARLFTSSTVFFNSLYSSCLWFQIFTLSRGRMVTLLCVGLYMVYRSFCMLYEYCQPSDVYLKYTVFQTLTHLPSVGDWLPCWERLLLRLVSTVDFEHRTVWVLVYYAHSLKKLQTIIEYLCMSSILHCAYFNENP